tara:strand:- start:688 stop:1503 length:816 start_codon:yes stop_codon:yes gene_type:complete
VKTNNGIDCNMVKNNTYWRKIIGIELFKFEYYSKWFLYNMFGVKLPKLHDQYCHWKSYGEVYMDEILSSGYLEREVFFQNLIIGEMKKLDFLSSFEAGCGFGWNIKRVKEEFPHKKVAGLDFSLTQLKNSAKYMNGFNIPVINGDNCLMPFKNGSFYIGFSLGVFMNIHPDMIKMALSEMIRVCKKYIIHVEYDEDNTTPELKEKRAFKTNIISHDYKSLYESMGKKVITFLTYSDFREAYYEFQKNIVGPLDRWEGFEGPEKYVLVVVEL